MIDNTSTTSALIYGEFDNDIVEINGDLYVMGNQYLESDENSKRDIKPIESSLEKILDIKGVSFKWKDRRSEGRKSPDRQHYGVIAQQVEEVLPEIVNKGNDGTRRVAYIELIPVLIEAVKDQQNTISELQKQNTTMLKKMSELEKELKSKGTMAMIKID